MPRDSVSMDFNGNSKSINSNAKGVVLDSGTSFIIMPESDYNGVLRVFEEEMNMEFVPINQKT